MPKKYLKLILANKKLAALHGLQAILLLFLATDFALPVTTSYQEYNPATESLAVASRHLFDVRLAWLVVAFFALSSMAHLYVSFIAPKQYVKNLKSGINKTRWIEYALSASTMMVAIAMLVGVEDLSTLLMIFGLTAIMNLLGLVMEVHNQTTDKTNWLSYWVGVLAGALPWIVVGIYFWGAESVSGAQNIPTFVYWIYGSIFLFFNCFAINMVLQYKQVGKWSDYLYGERAYMILSLVAKSALAWQIYAGTLRPV